MHYYLYKITNKINKKFYIGVHSTSNLEDGYMGSGKHLKRAINKYGIENFEKEILEEFDNSEDMYNAEKLLVTEELVKNPDTYNLKIGGEGGWDYINSNPTHGMIKNRKEFNKLIKELSKNPDYMKNRTKNYKLTISDPDYKIKFSNIMKEIILETGGSFKGKTHSEDTLKLLRKIYKENSHQKGEKNSQYGKMWIHSLIEKRSMRIDSKDPIPEGWIKGRKIKF